MTGCEVSQLVTMVKMLTLGGFSFEKDKIIVTTQEDLSFKSVVLKVMKVLVSLG